MIDTKEKLEQIIASKPPTHPIVAALTNLLNKLNSK